MTEDRSEAFSILGRAFHATGIDRNVAGWLRTFWSYPEHSPAEQGQGIDLVIGAEAPVSVGEGTPQPVVLPDRILDFRQRAGSWETGDHRAGLCLSLGDRGSRIVVWGFAQWADRAGFYHSLYAVLTEALRAQGLLPVHAAVAAHDGVVTAWLGPSGSGKSTTLLHATRMGWTPIAEDLCWLDPRTLTIYGWDRAVRVWPETLERFFPDLLDSSVAAADGKRCVSYQDLGAAARSGRLNRLAILGRDPLGPSRHEPVGSSEVVRALWEATGVPLSTPALEQASKTIAELTGRLCVERVIVGSAPPVL